MTREQITNEKASLLAQLKRGVISQSQYDTIMDFLEKEERK